MHLSRSLFLYFDDLSLYWNILSPPYSAIGHFMIKIESRNIVKVVQAIQVDLPKFCFAEAGSNLALPLQASCTTFTRCKRAFYGIK